MLHVKVKYDNIQSIVRLGTRGFICFFKEDKL